MNAEVEEVWEYLVSQGISREPMRVEIGPVGGPFVEVEQEEQTLASVVRNIVEGSVMLQEVMEKERDQMRRLLIDLYGAVSNVHITYPNTAVCWGGVGGQAITEHCAFLCDNPKHGEVVERLNSLMAETLRVTSVGR